MSRDTHEALREQWEPDEMSERDPLGIAISNLALEAENLRTRHIDNLRALDSARRIQGEVDRLVALRSHRETGRTLYVARCGWCGAYEGTVDPREPCARDSNTGEYIGAKPETGEQESGRSWQPWHTRPRDGHEVLGLFEDRVESVWCLPDGSWHWMDGDHGFRPPTHWMPLPAPPDTEESKP